jgi:hypothetical protein
VADDGLGAQLAGFTRLWVAGGFDSQLSAGTVDKIWPEHGPIAGEEYFLSREDGRILIPSYWFLTQRETPATSQWDRLRFWTVQQWLGEQLPALLTGTAGIRRKDGRIASVPEQQGHVFFGPYLPVPEGHYRAKLHLAIRDFAGCATLEAVINQTVIAARHFEGSDLESGLLSFDFDMLSSTDDIPLLEIRFDSPGGLAVVVDSLELEMREPYRLGKWPELPAASARPLVRAGGEPMIGE